MALTPVFDGGEALTFIAGEFPWHIDEPVRLHPRDLHDCNRFIAGTKEYLPLARQLHRFLLIDVFLLKKCPGSRLLARHCGSCKTVSHLPGPSE
jgi:hypothetical protein